MTTTYCGTVQSGVKSKSCKERMLEKHVYCPAYCLQKLHLHKTRISVTVAYESKLKQMICGQI